jgi:hypothetical protein
MLGRGDLPLPFTYERVGQEVFVRVGRKKPQTNQVTGTFGHGSETVVMKTNGTSHNTEPFKRAYESKNGNSRGSLRVFV